MDLRRPTNWYPKMSTPLICQTCQLSPCSRSKFNSHTIYSTHVLSMPLRKLRVYVYLWRVYQVYFDTSILQRIRSPETTKRQKHFQRELMTSTTRFNWMILPYEHTRSFVDTNRVLNIGYQNACEDLGLIEDQGWRKSKMRTRSSATWSYIYDVHVGLILSEIDKSD